ncbi:regulatory protein GemA [Chelativorans xinjiangense]|uniref:regulatory protein GemA n=1 Tax=Chelativorans xinjiangense TaxID=2681485 RepID=UPI00135A6E9A|nr:regulatory protein GemA [Chelativorans xinjiangense]
MISRLRNGSIQPKKIALLHVAKRQLGLDDDAYRDILKRWGGVETSRELEPLGFEKVMICLKELGFQSTGAKRNFGDRPGMATPPQVALIRRLWAQYDPDDQGEAHLNAWLHKYHHVSVLRFVSAEKAASVIPALKAMVGRK